MPIPELRLGTLFTAEGKISEEATMASAQDTSQKRAKEARREVSRGIVSEESHFA